MSSPSDELLEKQLALTSIDHPKSNQQSYSEVVGEEEIDLLEYWKIIWDNRKFIAIFTGVLTLISLLVSFFLLPVLYRSEAVLQPVAANQNTLNKLNLLAGGLTSVFGFSGDNSNSQQLVDFLTSRNLKQRLIEKYDLLPKLYEDDWDATLKKWEIAKPIDQPSLVKALQDEKFKDVFFVTTGKKTSLISIVWVDVDPNFASLMLERVIQELEHYLKFEYETDAQQERIFTEEQLEKAKHELEFWERQIPGPQRTKGEIHRELMASQLVYQELRKQLELAKIQEAKQVVSFKVLDRPFVPELKYKPKRAVICALTLMASGCIAVLLVFIRLALYERKIVVES